MHPLSPKAIVTAAVAAGKIDADWWRLGELERRIAQLAQAQARDDARRAAIVARDNQNEREAA
jgi:hypothetical protein